ncbi:MAG: class I SAM-dependent RNA methyltransferase, partial [Clostridia bacterium]|nr:class I SAM-dependent RNA methyltransferase [Clostridia bacterium]
KKTIDKIIEYKPASIIYTSCDPMTLVRDLKELTKYYDIKKFNLLDMFSYTYHVECVTLLCRKTL